MKGKTERKERALERKEAADQRSPQEQLSRLDRMFGEGQGAKKEREKLHKRIAEGQVSKKKEE
jgi:hypothetical protein